MLGAMQHLLDFSWDNPLVGLGIFACIAALVRIFRPEWGKGNAGGGDSFGGDGHGEGDADCDGRREIAQKAAAKRWADKIAR